MMAEHRYANDEDWPQTAKTCRERLLAENQALRTELADSHPRVMRFTPDFSEIDGTSVFIQWKGTDVCLDFHCECGEAGHFDGDFAYQLRCGACQRVWDLPHTLALVPQQRYGYEIIRDVEMDCNDPALV